MSALPQPPSTPILSSPILSWPGAVEADGVDRGVAAHYGNPLREQRVLLAGDGFVDLSNRGVVRIAGPDRLTWLHSLTTQALEGLAPHVATTTLILSPQGRVEHAMAGFDDGESFWAHVEPGEAPALVSWLDSMRFMTRVDVADVSPEWAAVARDETTVELVRRSELAESVHGEPCGSWAFEALRIARGEPRLGLDTDELTIPNEVGWIGSAVHLDKGCYRGQETVARVHTLGRPPRRLVLLHLDGSVDRLPLHGDAVTLEDKQVGFVGSAARHYELGPIALALVKRNVTMSAELLADGVAASQEPVVDPEVGLHVRARL
ncbi:MAG: YgfZ/GcvT domain-containing protein [Nocardioidaceae bacterium]